MAYIGLLIILAISYFIEWLGTRKDNTTSASAENAHKEIYALIDKHYSGREALERKAQADVMVSAIFKDNGREYKPKELKQVTTATERKERMRGGVSEEDNNSRLVEAQILDALDIGFSAHDADGDWYFEEHTQDEKREHLIRYFISTGVSKPEAEASADKFFKFAKEI